MIAEEMKTSTASEDFKSNRTDGSRYVDKTPLLAPLLRRDHESTFFLRPRRFGKTLTLSMIRYFVEDTRDEALNAENRALFKGLKIMEMGDFYTRQMTTWPVLHVSLQTVSGKDFESASQSLLELLQKLFLEKKWLLDCEALDLLEKRHIARILYGQDDTKREVSRIDVVTAFQNLTIYLRKATGKRAIVLIDEYDVPLEKAYRNGYYRQMVDIIGPMLQNVLKTNSANLQFAVVTGCLRIAKEGIYTGLNNPEVNTVYTDRLGDAFGFTETEVQKLLTDSGFADHMEEMREWYDGYRFGTTVIYNPWSVIKHIEALSANPKREPQLYWAGTSENAILREIAERADEATRDKAEQLVLGEEITFAHRDDIVYDDLFRDPDNVFNIMLATGYITAVQYDAETVRARIPNREVRQIYKDKFGQWFRETVASYDVKELFSCMERGDAERMEEIITDRVLSAMSYFDTLEAFYHGSMLTLFGLNGEYICRSNRESGDGRFDIICKQRRRWKLAFVLEFKVSEMAKSLRKDAQKAAAQIDEMRYPADLLDEGYEKILTYGISFFEKRCRVAMGKELTGVKQCKLCNKNCSIPEQSLE